MFTTIVPFSLALASLLTTTSAVPALRHQSAPARLQARATWPDPVATSGNISYIHDPSVIRRSDGTWFRFSTFNNIAIATAPALSGPWTYQGSMLPSGSSINVASNQGIWAPDVSLIGSTYYAYYAVSTGGSQNSGIGVATSTTLEPGSWTDHGSIGLPSSSSYNLIDPNFFRACDTCQNYFNFGSAWDDIYQSTLSSSFLTWSGAAVTHLSQNTTYPPGQTYPAIEEGSFLFWWPVNGVDYYYLFFSSGACCNAKGSLAAAGDEYKIMVCRATAPTGPFTDENGAACLGSNGGTLVLGSHGANVYAPGGQGVIYDPDVDKIALYYHYVNPNIGYAEADFQFGFNYVDFSSGWPVVSS